MTEPLMSDGFETRAIRMEPLWQVAFQAPEEDVDRIFDKVTEFAPLNHGKTDRTAFRTACGIEFYRPREGTPTGAEDKLRKRPGVVEVAFFIPRETEMLDQVIEAIYEVHSYYEPVITVREVLRSTCKGLDDRDNPHRWWNTTGDWKASTSAS